MSTSHQTILDSSVILSEGLLKHNKTTAHVNIISNHIGATSTRTVAKQQNHFIWIISITSINITVQ